MLQPGKHAKNVRGISPPSLLSRFTQHYLVAMATPLDKSSVLNEPRERTSDGQRQGALYYVLYNLSNTLCYLRSNHDVNTQHNFHLLACSPQKRQNYWTDLHQNFTQYSGISGVIKSCIYKALVHSVSDDNDA